MPLHVPPAPPAASRSVLAALRSPSPASPRTGAVHLPAGTPPGPLEPELPLPLHEMTPFDRPAGSPPSRASRAGGSCCGRAAPRPAPPPPRRGGRTDLRRLDVRLLLRRPVRHIHPTALKQAESLPEPFQPRLLSVPHLYMLTLWLHRTPAPTPPRAPRSRPICCSARTRASGYRGAPSAPGGRAAAAADQPRGDNSVDADSLV